MDAFPHMYVIVRSPFTVAIRAPPTSRLPSRHAYAEGCFRQAVGG
jgi:hypothetical protein